MAPILTLSGITASNSGLWQTDGCHKGAGRQSAAESDVFRGFTWGFPCQNLRFDRTAQGKINVEHTLVRWPINPRVGIAS